MISSNINFNVKFNHDLKNWLFISYLSFSKKKKKILFEICKAEIHLLQHNNKIKSRSNNFFFLKQNYQE